MNNNDIAYDRGKVKKLFVIIAVLCFLAFQCVLVYGILLITNNSFAGSGSKSPKIVKRTAEEANTAAKIVELFDAYEKSRLYFLKFELFSTGDYRDKKYQKDLEANLSTIETVLIKYLDIDSNSTLSAFILGNRILFSEKFSYVAERNAARALSAYADYKIRKGDVVKALSAVNSLLSLSMIAQMGNGGEKHLLSGMIAISIKKMACASVIGILNSKTPLSAQQLASLTDKLQKYSALYDDIFSMIADEKNSVNEKTFSEFFADVKAHSTTVQWVVANLVIDMANLYYGDSIKQYNAIMNEILACKSLTFKEAAEKLDVFTKKIQKINGSVIELLNSDINPMALMAVPNVKRALEQHIVSKLMCNSVLLRAAIQKRVLSGMKPPADMDELSKMDEVKKIPGICKDLYNEMPLKYSVSSTGEVSIYSVGPDMIDNGGKFGDLDNDGRFGTGKFGSISGGTGFQTYGYDVKL